MMSGENTPTTEQSSLLPYHPPSSASDSSTSSTKSRHSTEDDARLNNKTEPQLSKLKGSLVIASIGFLIFLQSANFSILTTTQSDVAADLDAFESSTWLTASYLVAMSSISPLMGRFNQVFSPRNCIILAALTMCCGSIIVAISNSIFVFLLGRVIAGAGSAGVLITASILVIQMAPVSTRGILLGLLNTCMTVGVSLGAILAGALEPKIGWKSMFGLQAPISFAAGVALWFTIPKHFGREDKGVHEVVSLTHKLGRLDYLGVVTLTAIIVLFLVGLSSQRVLLIPIILSIAIFPVFIWNESYWAKEPIIPLTVLKSRGALLTCLATVGFMMARWGVLFYTPVFAIAVRAWAPAAAGSLLIPTNAGFALGGIIAGWLHIRRTGSFYMASLVVMIIFPVTLAALALLSTNTSSMTIFVLVLFFNGLFTGSTLNYTLVHVLHLTPTVVHPIILSLLATFRGFAGSFGSAIGGGLFQRLLYGYLRKGFNERGLEENSDLIRRLIGSPALVKTLTGQERDVAESAYIGALKGLFLAGAILATLMVVVQAGTGWKGPSDELAMEEDDGQETYQD